MSKDDDRCSKCHKKPSEKDVEWLANEFAQRRDRPDKVQLGDYFVVDNSRSQRQWSRRVAREAANSSNDANKQNNKKESGDQNQKKDDKNEKKDDKNEKKDEKKEIIKRVDFEDAHYDRVMALQALLDDYPQHDDEFFKSNRERIQRELDDEREQQHAAWPVSRQKLRASRRAADAARKTERLRERRKEVERQMQEVEQEL